MHVLAGERTAVVWADGKMESEHGCEGGKWRWLPGWRRTERLTPIMPRVVAGPACSGNGETKGSAAQGEGGFKGAARIWKWRE